MSSFLKKKHEPPSFGQLEEPLVAPTFAYGPHYVPHLTGWCIGENTQTALPMLFNAYRESLCSIEYGCVPGFAFKERLPYLEVKDAQLLASASNDVQQRFYQEAGIKIAAFLGCKSGEIELGISMPRNVSFQMEITNLFTEIFQQSQLGENRRCDPSRPCSSSSSLMSLSVGSPENTSLLFNMPKASYVADPLEEPPAENAACRNITSTAISSPHQLPLQDHGGAMNIQLPTPASDDAAMARAMLAVVSSSSSSSSSYQFHRTQPNQRQVSHIPGAFRTYMQPFPPLSKMMPHARGRNMMKRAFALLKTIPSARGDASVDEPRPTTSQLQHMISERQRREKLSEFFQVLRGLLPPGTKKDKASVLSKAVELLIALKAQVLELTERNRILETRLGPSSREVYGEGWPGNERVEVRVSEASECSSSEGRQIEVQVGVDAGTCEMEDLIIRLLNCLKEMNNVRVISLEADTQLRGMHPFNRATIVVTVKTADWNEQSFKEAMTRSVDGGAP